MEEEPVLFILVGSRNNSVDRLEIVGEFISEAAYDIKVSCGLTPKCRGLSMTE